MLSAVTVQPFDSKSFIDCVRANVGTPEDELNAAVYYLIGLYPSNCIKRISQEKESVSFCQYTAWLNQMASFYAECGCVKRSIQVTLEEFLYVESG